MFQQFPHSQCSDSMEDTAHKMEGCGKDAAESSKDLVSETKADTYPSSLEDQKQEFGAVKLSSKPGRPSKGKFLDKVLTKQKVDALLEEEVSRNNRLKKRNKEIQERLQRVVKLYISLIERQRIVFLKSRESE